MSGQTHSICTSYKVQSRHQVVGKLGYGAYSTLWLARDPEYVIYKLLDA